LDAYKIEQFAESEGIIGRVDLIIFGESFHWFDPKVLVPILRRILCPSQGKFALFGYWLYEFMCEEGIEEIVDNNKKYLDNFEVHYNPYFIIDRT